MKPFRRLEPALQSTKISLGEPEKVVSPYKDKGQKKGEDDHGRVKGKRRARDSACHGRSRGDRKYIHSSFP